MEIELKEIYDFLAEHTPFTYLSEAQLSHLPQQITIRYLRRGSPFPPPETDESLFILRSGAVELRDQQDDIITRLSEGDILCNSQQIDHMAALYKGQTTEDSLIYILPYETIQQLSQQSDAFSQHFHATLSERIQHALATRQQPSQQVWPYRAMALEVNELTDRIPVTLDHDCSIEYAAQMMSQENVAAVLIMRDQKLVGVLTDRDLRRRCLAAGVSRHTPVSQIMSDDVIHVEHDTLLSDALLIMTHKGIHHLPIMHHGQPVGNLSVSDIVRHLSTNPAFLSSDIEKAHSVDALVKISQRLPELQLQLANANTTALHIGEAISSITDSLTRRLLNLAEHTFGPPPVPYVWAAGGSQARAEQTSHSDQDNALILSNEVQPEHHDYFSKLSQFVSDGLNACGYIYCPGNAMATNPNWCQPLDHWKNQFDIWIHKPEPKSLMLSSIFFDLRPIYGDRDLYHTLQKHVLKQTQENGIFLSYMVANALTHRPPLGFFRQFVLIPSGEHNKTLDIKHRGIVPIVDIARIYALANGLTDINTTHRLQQAQACGALSADMASNLMDALELISSLRIEHQAHQIRHAKAADNYLSPSELSGLQRHHLKDAFSIIKTMQEVLENRYQAGRLI